MWGVSSRKSHHPCPRFPTGESVQRFFYVFIFASEEWDGEEGGSRGLGAWSVHTAPLLMLSQCFLSLSLELVLQYQLGTLAHLMPGGQQKKTGRSARARCGGGTSTLPAARRSSPICLPHHRLLLPSPPGPQCSGRGEPQRLCLALGSRPRNAIATPGHQQIHVATCTEDFGGHRGTSPAGPPRLQLY